MFAGKAYLAVKPPRAFLDQMIVLCAAFAKDKLFMTLPTYLRQNGYITAGNGKIFHPDACNGMMDGNYSGFTHQVGDDPRSWSYGEYYVERTTFDNATSTGQPCTGPHCTQEQFGSVPGPWDVYFNGTQGASFLESPLTDEEETDGMLATNAWQRPSTSKLLFLALHAALLYTPSTRRLT